MKTVITARLLEPPVSDVTERKRIEQIYVNELIRLFETPEGAHVAYIAAIEVWIELGEYPNERATEEQDAIMLDWLDKNRLAVSVAFGRVVPDLNQFELTFRDVIEEVE
jgi:hypothetical protein